MGFEHYHNIIGYDLFDNQIELQTKDRRSHVHLLGRSGTGKTTLMRNLIFQDILAGRGVSLIDPHGDLAEDILSIIPENRARDVVYFDPSDREYPMSLNLFDQSGHQDPEIVASAILSTFKSLWAGISWGPRMEYILAQAIQTLIAGGGCTMLGIKRILIDYKFRCSILAKTKDPFLDAFWISEFDNLNPKQRAENISPILNKAGQFITSATKRNILGQPKTSIDTRFIMDSGKIFIANLSKGKLGEDVSNLLGSLLVSSFQLSSMSRSDIPEGERLDHYLYIDEFQNFASESFASILSEARKYRLNLTLSHQYMEQLPVELLNAVMGNVASTIAFRVGAKDAERLVNKSEQMYAGCIKIEELVRLKNHQIFCRLLNDGEAEEPFLATTYPSIGEPTGGVENLKKASRQRYSQPKSEIEARILRWQKN